MYGVSLSPLQLPWVIYAIGHGEGALERAMAIATLAAHNRQIIILTNSPYASVARNQISQTPALQSRISIQSVPYVVSSQDASIGSNTAESNRAEAALQLEQLCSIAPFVLIVDAPPDGFYQELTDILTALNNIPKVLVLRDLEPQHIIARDLEHFIKSHYDLAIAPGAYEAPYTVEQLFSLQPNALQFDTSQFDIPQFDIQRTPPWLGKSIYTSVARAVARHLLGLAVKPTDDADTEPNTNTSTDSTPDSNTRSALGNNNKTILVISSQEPGERSTYDYLCAALVQQCPQVIVRYVSPLPPDDCPVDIWYSDWPATKLLPAADLVIGAGNYANIYACQLLSIPLIAFPWMRQDDLQRQRLERAAANQKSSIKIVTSAASALSCVFEFLNQGITHSPAPPSSAQPSSDLPPLAPPSLDNVVVGTQIAVDLIESIAVRKWHQAAQIAMESDINQFREQCKAQHQTQRFDTRQELW
ncbi:MAG: hypothetical protein AAF703_08410 [Cyanobacteria bacterium P01_D01_bin.105]